jgi:hypothetical protein
MFEKKNGLITDAKRLSAMSPTRCSLGRSLQKSEGKTEQAQHRPNIWSKPRQRLVLGAQAAGHQEDAPLMHTRLLSGR